MVCPGMATIWVNEWVSEWNTDWELNSTCAVCIPTTQSVDVLKTGSIRSGEAKCFPKWMLVLLMLRLVVGSTWDWEIHWIRIFTRFARFDFSSLISQVIFRILKTLQLEEKTSEVLSKKISCMIRFQIKIKYINKWRDFIKLFESARPKTWFERNLIWK